MCQLTCSKTTTSTCATCQFGRWGPQCVNVCPGGTIASDGSAPNACSGSSQGSCSSTGTCVCLGGYTGQCFCVSLVIIVCAGNMCQYSSATCSKYVCCFAFLTVDTQYSRMRACFAVMVQCFTMARARATLGLPAQHAILALQIISMCVIYLFKYYLFLIYFNINIILRSTPRAHTVRRPRAIRMARAARQEAVSATLSTRDSSVNRCVVVLFCLCFVLCFLLLICVCSAIRIIMPTQHAHVPLPFVCFLNSMLFDV